MIDKLITKIKEHNPRVETFLIKKAFEFAQIAHAGQKRKSGHDFITHPVAVAQILAEWKLDTSSIVAGLLHDTIEEGGTTLSEIKKEFGAEIARLVDGVSITGKVKLRGSTDDKFVENLRKMFLAMTADLRVVLIKLADRLHNMRTLDALSAKKQIRIAKETLEIYVPLAERLGIGELKGQLEDLAFPYVHPEGYKWVKKYSASFYKKASEDMLRAKKKLYKALADQGIKTAIHGRAKHLYSLYLKLLRSEIGKDIRKVHDIAALRILVGSVRDCYAALGVVHEVFKPVPKLGVSDFIAQPKPNGYRSLHTRVFGPKGRIMEVQIRTYRMHEEAENGIAAHWCFAEEKIGVSDEKVEQGFFAPSKKLGWVKQLSAWQKAVENTYEFLESLKFDALSCRIFVFSPKGDVYDLPLGATPVDFAYTVHTDLGDCCRGAKVNGKLTFLGHKLKSGDIVEIISAKEKKGPSRDWLNFVVTATARQNIARYFRSKKS
jgi:guanosine-3',5'-bis(diphosphate) 3'-pyrophosphohydrolase